MSWFRRRPAEPEPEQRSVNLSIADPAVALLLGYGDGIGPSVSDYTAMTLSSVWRAVCLIAGTIASLPLRSLEDANDGSRNRIPSFLDSPAGAGRMTPFEWKELVVIHLLLHGNAFLQHVKNGAGAMVGLWPIHPLCVEVIADSRVVGGKRFLVTFQDGTEQEFDGSSMTQIMGPTLDGLRGLSAISVARLSLGTGLSGDKAAHRMFVNGGLVSGLVSPDEDITEDEAVQIKNDLVNKMTGTENAGGIALINRKLKFQSWSLSATDLQFLQSRAFQIEEVARWFGVPPHLLAAVDKQTSWGTGVAEQNRGLARYTLQHWTSRIEQRLTNLLPGQRFAEFDYTAFLRPSPETEIPLLLQQVIAGVMTPNEMRHIRNMPPIPGGDAIRLPVPAQVIDTPNPVEPA